MRRVLDKLVDLTKNLPLLPPAVEEFQSLLQAKFEEVFPEGGSYTPIALAESLLKHLPLNHPVFYLKPLAFLDSKMIEIYDQLCDAGSRERFLLCEFYQGLKTKMAARLSYLRACYCEYNEQLTESLNETLLDMMAQQGEIELVEVKDWVVATKQYMEKFTATNSDFKLLHAKWLAVKDLLTTLQLEDEVDDQLAIFDAKLQHYKKLLTQHFSNDPALKLVNKLIDNSLWVGKALISSIKSQSIDAASADAQPAEVEVILPIANKKPVCA